MSGRPRAFGAPAFLAALALALVAGCQRGATLESFSGPAQGSSYSIQYVRRSGGPAVGTVRKEVQGILDEVDRQLSVYRDDSDMARFNRLPAGGCQKAPAPLLELVGYGLELSRLSGGAYDLTVGPLLDAWGFGPHSQGHRVPAPEELAELRGRIGYQHLRLGDGQLCKDAPVTINPNSIAAGFTVDWISRRFEALGVMDYLVEVTGELKAKGRKPDGSPWRIALEAPREDQRVAARVVEVDGYGVSTSGDYRNYFTEQGKRYSHHIDPRTLAPQDNDLASVSVIDRQAMHADGLGTVLLLLGADEGFALAQRQNIAALFVQRQGGAFKIRATTALERQFKPQNN